MNHENEAKVDICQTDMFIVELLLKVLKNKP